MMYGSNVALRALTALGRVALMRNKGEKTTECTSKDCFTFDWVDRFYKLKCLNRCQVSEKHFCTSDKFRLDVVLSQYLKNKVKSKYFCKNRLNMRSDRNSTEIEKFFSPSRHLLRHSNF